MKEVFSQSCRKLPIRRKGDHKTNSNVTPLGNARRFEMWEEGILCSLGGGYLGPFPPLYSNGPTASCPSSADQPSGCMISPCRSHDFFCLHLLALSVCRSVYLSVFFPSFLLPSLPLSLPTSLRPSLLPSFPLSLFLLSSPLCVSLDHYMSRRPPHYPPLHTSPSYFPGGSPKLLPTSSRDYCAPPGRV